MPGGRPTKYQPEYAKQAYKLTLLGHIDKELADFFEVDESTIHNWKKEHPQFFQSIKDGKAIADADVAVSLYERATGYSHKETKVFVSNGEPIEVEIEKHHPPDTGAACMWLKNRQPAKWRDKPGPEDAEYVMPVKVQFIEQNKSDADDTTGTD